MFAGGASSPHGSRGGPGHASAHNVKYWRDGEGRHHVPKRTLEEIIIG